MRCLLAGSLAAAASMAVARDASAQAQEGEFSVQRFEPAAGGNNLLSVERVRMVEQWGWSAGLWFNYARNPFVVVSCRASDNCDEPNATQVEDVPVVSDMMQWDLTGSINPLDFLQVGLRIPVAYVNG